MYLFEWKKNLSDDMHQSANVALYKPEYECLNRIIKIITFMKFITLWTSNRAIDNTMSLFC